MNRIHILTHILRPLLSRESILAKKLMAWRRTEETVAYRTYQLTTRSSQNNSKFTLTDPKQKVVFWTSSGMHGYRKFNRSTYAAPPRWSRDWKTRRSGFRRTARTTLIFEGFGQAMTNGVAIQSRRNWAWMINGQNFHQSRRSTAAQGRTPIGIISHVCLLARVSHMAQCPQGSL